MRHALMQHTSPFSDLESTTLFKGTSRLDDKRETRRRVCQTFELLARLEIPALSLSHSQTTMRFHVPQSLADLNSSHLILAFMCWKMSDRA